MSELAARVRTSISNSLVQEEDSSNSDVTIHDLPYHVLDYVFSFLSIKERVRTEWVCRRWAEFGTILKWNWPKKLDNAMLRVGYRGYLLNTSDYNIWASVLHRCGQSLRQLEIRLEFGVADPSGEVLVIVGTNCPSLIEIKLDLNGNLPPNIGRFLIDVARGCQNLHSFSLRSRSSRKLTGDLDNTFTDVCDALKEFRSLEFLELDCNSPAVDRGCWDAIDVELKGFKLWISEETKFPTVAEKLLKRSYPIEVLDLKWHDGNPADWPAKVVRHYQNTLKVLRFNKCKMSPGMWDKIPSTLTHLEVVSLRSSLVVDDNFMKALVDNCRNLKMLDIEGTHVTDFGISMLEDLRQLTVVNLSKCTGKGLQNLATRGLLEKVRFCDVKGRGNLVESSCVTLANSCPNLHSVYLNSNAYVTQRVVEEFCAAVLREFLKGPVLLNLGFTPLDEYSVKLKVMETMKGCDNLKLDFDLKCSYL